jgi:hypothetical protein
MGWLVRHFYTDTYIAQHSPYQGFSVTGYITTGVKPADRGRLWAYKWRFKQPLLVHTSLMICPITPSCQLSLWEETGVPGENPRLSAERWLLLFSHEDWVRVTLSCSHWELNLRHRAATLEVKGKCTNHFATEQSRWTHYGAIQKKKASLGFLL